jgi:hypothetical protein
MSGFAILWRTTITAQASRIKYPANSYIALLIAAGVTIGNVVTFLAFYLRGELTSRFSAKVAVTLLISAGVFWYYLGSLREARKGATHAR